MNPLVTLTSDRLYRDGLGVPAWGPAGLLHDLELRLGVPPCFSSTSLRVRSYAERIEDARPPALDASFAADRLGTAAAVLALRDALVDAGWDCGALPEGGGRLAAVAAIEALGGTPPPPGPPDRLAAVEAQLCGPLYESITLLPEELALWPARWLRVLRKAGSELRTWSADFTPAPARSDLWRVQQDAPGQLEGDGSVIILRADTSLELAEAAAAEIAATSGETLVVRDGDPASLDLALQSQGLPPLGDGAGSAAQPLLQLLPLALELSFAPKDPRCAIDLLLLPGGPFDPYVGHRLAATLSQYPSIGGRRWIECRSKLRNEDGPAVSEWLETPGLPAQEAPVEKILARLALVRSHLQGSPHEVAAAALAQVGELEAIIRAHPRANLSRLEVRAFLDATRTLAACPLSAAGAGRVEHVDDPCLALRSSPQVLWWCFADRPMAGPLTWHRAERRALAAAGLPLPDPGAFFAARAEGWRRALRAAGRRLILAVPGSIAGVRTAPHPLWDEIRGRLGVGDAGEARITRCPIGPRLLAPLALPNARTEWAAPPDLLVTRTRSPKSIQALLDCSLKWALEHQARIVRRELASMPDRRVLEGFLAHRMAEELVRSGALAEGPDAACAAVPGLLERLIDDEASHLRLAGMSFDLQAITRTLHHAMGALVRLVHQARLTDVKAEQPLGDVTWRGAALEGRTDLIAVAPGHGPVVIDLKRRSANRLRETLRRGRAIQLAAYAFALKASSAYFSITNAALLTTSPEAFGRAYANAGPGDLVTWSLVEDALTRAEAVLAQGRIPVAGLSGSPEAAEALGPPLLSRRQVQDEVCSYCAFAPVCGRQWEELS
jgi:hypothetical protein